MFSTTASVIVVGIVTALFIPRSSVALSALPAAVADSDADDEISGNKGKHTWMTRRRLYAQTICVFKVVSLIKRNHHGVVHKVNIFTYFKFYIKMVNSIKKFYRTFTVILLNIFTQRHLLFLCNLCVY